MKSWPSPVVPTIPARHGNPVPLRLYDTADQRIREVSFQNPEGPAGMYVCGITPYDSTHLGHAATYLTFDLLYRALLDNGRPVHFVQNVTDVDDPLFERAERDNQDWRELGTEQTDLFRSDMEQLGVIPPQHFMSVSETVDEIIDIVGRLLDQGKAYVLDGEYPDIYAPIAATKQFGYESNFTREEMLEVFAERGGDPERPGKHDELDALIWKAERKGEPAWEAPFGRGRPGWHIECAAIAANRLGARFDIQGGGSDLVFPHHEFSAAHIEAAYEVDRMAGHYVHAGMIGLDGTKMSKSLGNLVFIHKLTANGHEPSAIRLGVYSQHYRSDRDWSEELLAESEQRLALWRAALQQPGSLGKAEELVRSIRECIADDLDSPGALQAVDAWAKHPRGEDDPETAALVACALDSLFGISLQ